jgi:hypothetical protein
MKTLHIYRVQRFVRYDPKGRFLSKQFSEADGSPISNADKVVDLAFKMDRIRLTLHRDDNDSIDSEIVPPINGVC